MNAAAFPIAVNGVIRARSAADDDAQRGFGVFDTLLVEDGVRWHEDRHLARLRAACAHFAIPAFECWDVAGELARYVERLGGQRALVRTLASRGACGASVAADGPALVIEARTPRALPSVGVELQLVECTPDPLGAWKTTDRAERARHADAAERAGCFDALRATDAGEIVEAARANVFAVVDGVVRTPPLAAGVLPGIVRGLLLESLPEAVEARIGRDDLARASEMWLTSSGLGVAAVRGVRGTSVEFSGPHGRHFQRAAAALAHREAEYAAAWRARDYKARTTPD